MRLPTLLAAALLALAPTTTTTTHALNPPAVESPPTGIDTRTCPWSNRTPSLFQPNSRCGGRYRGPKPNAATNPAPRQQNTDPAQAKRAGDAAAVRDPPTSSAPPQQHPEAANPAEEAEAIADPECHRLVVKTTIISLTLAPEPEPDPEARPDDAFRAMESRLRSQHSARASMRGPDGELGLLAASASAAAAEAGGKGRGAGGGAVEVQLVGKPLADARPGVKDAGRRGDVGRGFTGVA